MKKILLLGVVVGMVILAAGCKAKDSENTNETQSSMELKINPPKQATMKMEDLEIQNGENTIYGKLYAPIEEGKHPAIIMCHGYNGTSNDFRNECSFFAQNGIVAYAFDFCGGSVNSKSTGKTTDMTIFTEKSDLLAVFDYFETMDIVDADQIFLHGGSQGGLIATLAAEERADKVKGLLLYFPAINIPDNWRGTYPNVDDIPETVDFWGLTLGKKFFADMHDFHTLDNIGSFDKDVLILQGDKDEIVPMSSSVALQNKYAHAELITMTGEGHGFTPAGVNIAKEKMLEFIQNHTN